MSDNISRQAAKDAIAEKVFHNLTDEFYGVMQVLDELPSADRTGHWVSKDGVYGVVYCSECDYELHINDTDFCPECGAYMRGEQDE